MKERRRVVPGRWQGETVVCVASGPSLTIDQLARVREARAQGLCRVIAVNDNYRVAPFADVLYACDLKWWGHHYQLMRSDPAACFLGELWSGSRAAAAKYNGLFFVEGLSRPGLSKSYTTIHHGGNSGYQAIGLAHQFGAARIVLIGYDMQRTGGRSHWFGDHPKGWTNAPGLARWVANYHALARDLIEAGVVVVNCTIETALTCFDRVALEEIL